MFAPKEIAKRGEKLYKDQFQQQYELSHPGKFLAIDVTTPNGTVYVADTPEAALKTGQKSNPQGFFHVVRIGFPAVYRVGYPRSLDELLAQCNPKVRRSKEERRWLTDKSAGAELI